MHCEAIASYSQRGLKFHLSRELAGNACELNNLEKERTVRLLCAALSPVPEMAKKEDAKKNRSEFDSLGVEAAQRDAASCTS
jgi:hypothetical protein